MTIRAFLTRDHGAVPPLRRFLGQAVVNATVWTTCLAAPTILLHLLMREM
jgi:hypothetical protein